MTTVTAKTYVSPIIEIEYAHIKEPDTAFNKAGGIYQLDGLFDRKDQSHRDFVKLMQSLAPEGAQQKVWKLPSEDSAHVKVKFKQNARVQNGAGKTFEGFQPVVYDAKGNKIAPQDIPLLGNGSRVRVRVEPRQYTLKGGGVRLRPVAVQIVELVEYVAEEKDEDDPMGFGAVDGGFEVEQDQGFDSVQPLSEPIREQQTVQEAVKSTRISPEEAMFNRSLEKPAQMQPQAAASNSMPDFDEF